ncbi:MULTISPECIES: PE family protein [Mycobacterium]|uniref:PE family protein n=1 Tax=Mycobacterium TaxID=1763 RepID=UPI001CD95C9F|nr:MULTISPECIES: PE family protein [Mycobacterium]MCA2244818.1 PE family protein [Mycobacterium sp. WUMAC-067]MCA2316126.1 PE family protein [Mycobacterium sp. WUMAC-025]MEE3752692.1 PE family protein [Mycobacterium intracellulare]
MSFVSGAPDKLSAAAANLQSIGAALNAENTAAAGPTVAVVPAAADEVSVLAAVRFAAHAQRFQELSARAAAIQDLLAVMLAASAGSYAATEAANAASAD